MFTQTALDVARIAQNTGFRTSHAATGNGTTIPNGEILRAVSDEERRQEPAAVEITVVSPRSEAAVWCLAQYFAELGQRFSGGFDSAKTTSAEPEELTPPAGYFLLAQCDGRTAGCGGLKCGPDGVGEIKRMWVAPFARGAGIGRRLLAGLEACALRAGLRAVRLDTNETLTEALCLYRTAGYREIAPYNSQQYAHFWFEKTLAPASEPSALSAPWEQR